MQKEIQNWNQPRFIDELKRTEAQKADYENASNKA